MNKLTILACLICFTASMFLSGCATTKNNGQMLHYKRKFEHLVKNDQQAPTEKKQTYGVIDLSDGQKVNYDTPFGPSFDIKY